MMEKALLVRVNAIKASGRKGAEAADEALAELNEHLSNGWRVKEARPTSGTNIGISLSLVILTNDN